MAAPAGKRKSSEPDPATQLDAPSKMPLRDFVSSHPHVILIPCEEGTTGQTFMLHAPTLSEELWAYLDALYDGNNEEEEDDDVGFVNNLLHLVVSCATHDRWSSACNRLLESFRRHKAPEPTEAHWRLLRQLFPTTFFVGWEALKGVSVDYVFVK